ncbi:unnamed protein product, partial [Adineta steineri]
MLALIERSHAYVLLYNTETNDLWEYSDCAYYNSRYNDTIKYCVRPRNTSAAIECANEGEKWLFTDLLANNISPGDVLSWSSSIEVADNYAHAFYNRSTVFSADTFLCKCTNNMSFGKHCEYSLFNAFTIEAAIQLQFILKFNKIANHRWAAIVCYETLSCDFGLLCLDWRNICDGEQQCMDGVDEQNCDKLEFNECEENEYRCDLDCMDHSDEPYHNTLVCFTSPADFECDERMGPRTVWSCGDGVQIVPWMRLPYQQIIMTGSDCSNFRNLNYICETSRYVAAWTLPNGMCEFSRNYDDPRFDGTTANMSSMEMCVYLLKCGLTDGFERDCPCGRNTSCYNLMISYCPNPQWIQYPNMGLIRPYVLTYYIAQESYSDKTPAYFVFSGTIQCRGYRAVASTNMNITILSNHVPQYILSPYKDFYFCLNALIEKNTSVSIKYFPVTCWNDSRTFLNHSYNYIDICPNFQQCISAYRINDGDIDCPHGEDEKVEIATSPCAKIQRHRFQCSPLQKTCFPVRVLGTGERCTNKFDQYVYGTGKMINSISCKHRNDDGCRFLKTYVEESSKKEKNVSSIVHSIETIPHRFYCDSHWDVYPPTDEKTEFCQEWTCRKQWFRCKTHQCIPLKYVCDGEWDCSDASDEQAIFSYKNVLDINQDIQNLSNIIEKNCKKPYLKQPYSNFCNISNEYPCLLANVTNPLDIKRNRPCINLALIGDGVYDCYGGLDERNTATGCQKRMKGFDFPCENRQYCIPLTTLCTRHCPNNEDASLCFHNRKNDACNGFDDANRNSRIRIQVADFPSGENTLGSVVQYYDVNDINMNLIPRYRQVFHEMPSDFGFDHNLTQVPILAVL